jgi:hypothetical protein
MLMLLGVVVMVVVGMMVVVMGSLRSLIASLRQARCHAAVEDLCLTSFHFFPRPAALLPSTTRFQSTSVVFIIGTSNLCTFHVP